MNLPMLGRGRARDEADSPEKDESAERKMFGEAYDALKEGDRDGFIEACIAGARACYKADEDKEEPDGDEG